MKHPKSYDSTPEKRKRMSKVRLKKGKAETILAKRLWHEGYRYRRNYKKLPGSLKCSPFVRQCGIIEIYRIKV